MVIGHMKELKKKQKNITQERSFKQVVVVLTYHHEKMDG